MNNKIKTLIILALFLLVFSLIKVNPDLSNVHNPITFIFILTLLAIADSLNPCMISVMAIMVANLFSLGLDKKSVLKRAVVFTFVCFITYFALGLLIYKGYNYFYAVSIASKGFRIMKLVLFTLLFVSGIINLIDALKRSENAIFSIPNFAKFEIKKLMNYASLIASILLALFVTIVELPCTGIFYLGLIAYIHEVKKSFASVLLILLYYNLIFIIPEILITLLVSLGYDAKEIYEKIYEQNRFVMRFIEGLILIILAFIVLFVVGGGL